MSDCELCELTAEPGLEASGPYHPVWRDDKLKVIMVDDQNYPGFCRVIWNEHVKEMTDLLPSDRKHLMDIVWRVEEAVREVMDPDKVNVASLGNVVPHLHWHVIPRYTDDAHFPNPVWAAAVRVPDPAVIDVRRALVARLANALVTRLQTP